MIPIELGFMRHNFDCPEQGQQLIDWAMEHGINHFEHCSFYLNWKCEEYMYSLLKKYSREKYCICGKMPMYDVITRRDFKELYKEQLNKVPGHYFDTYILQAVDDRVSLNIYEQNIIPFFLEEKRKGNIKRFGLSIQCLPEVFEKYLKLQCWDVVQMPINYYDWFLCRYNENYELARKYNLPIIAQAPVKGGLLLNNKNIPKDSFISYERSNLEAAYDFVSQLEGIELILCGNSRLKTFKDTYNALNSSMKIPLEEFSKIIKNYSETIAPIQCLSCMRCDRACEMGLPLAAFIRMYNLALKNKYYFNAYSILKDSIPDPLKICNHCGKCESMCPVDNNIPQILKDKIFELRT